MARPGVKTAMVVTGIGMAAVAAVGGGVVAVIDGVSYTIGQLAQLGPAVIARLVAAGKLTSELANRVYMYLFAQGNNAGITSGLLNSNNYFRIGEGFNQGNVVFRIAIGSKNAPLPSWIPGLYKGTFHIDLWRF